MHLDDFDSPVTQWLVLLLVLEESGPLNTSRLMTLAASRTEGRVARYLPHVTATMRKLELHGVVESRRTDARKPTREWSITTDGRWFLSEALRLALGALAPRRTTHGTTSKARRRTSP